MRATEPSFETTFLTVLLTTLAVVVPSVLSAQSVTHTYDTRGRLVASDYGGGSSLSFGYDEAGNIVTTTDSGPANTLWVSVQPPGFGLVSGPGISCPGDCKEPFSGTPQVSLIATDAMPGYSFLAWGGGWSSFANPADVTMDADRHVTVYFGADDGSSDADGVVDTVEMGPSGDDVGYDGDANGVPDYLEARVASLPTFIGDGYATLAVPEGLTLFGVAAVDDPAPGHLYHHAFPLGFFDFTILGLDPGGCTTMTMLLTHPSEMLSLDTYDKYGPYPGHPDPAWYQFDHDGATGVEIDAGDTETTVELAFCDAHRGDDVLTEDSQVIDDGGPVHIQCLSLPNFYGWPTIENHSEDGCALLVSWEEGVNYCGTGLVYNLYRSTTPGFIPGPSNRIEDCVVGNSYLDTNVEFGVEYFYRVNAEDNSGEADGPCYRGNVGEGNEENSGTALGEPSAIYENDLTTFADFVAEPGPNDSGSDPWVFPWTPWHQSPPSSVAVLSEEAVKDQLLVLTVSQFIQPVGFTYLEFFHTLSTEPDRDGGVLEYTTDNGAAWFDILDGNGGSIPPNPDRFLDNGYNAILAPGNDNPLPGRAAWSDRSYGLVVVDVRDFGGHSVRFRWRFGCDASVAVVGWALDDVVLRHVDDCSSFGLIFDDGFESGDTDAWSNAVP